MVDWTINRRGKLCVSRRNSARYFTPTKIQQATSGLDTVYVDKLGERKSENNISIGITEQARSVQMYGYWLNSFFFFACLQRRSHSQLLEATRLSAVCFPLEFRKGRAPRARFLRRERTRKRQGCDKVFPLLAPRPIAHNALLSLHSRG